MANPPPSRWKPGQSGNPKGRPPSSVKTAELRTALGQAVPKILVKMTELALNGDVSAARLIMERCIPALKAVEQIKPIDLPDGTLTNQGRAVMALIANGEIAPDTGSQLITALGTLARVAEIDELTARITILENRQ